MFEQLLVRYRQGIVHFIKFNFVGILNTGITLAVFALLTRFFGVDPLIAEPIGYSLGLVNSFIMNKLWTFAKKHSFSFWEAFTFTIVNLIAFGGTWLFLYLNKTFFHADSLLVKLSSLLYSIPCNFIGSKYVVFRD
jgi:putative flippase GtrA